MFEELDLEELIERWNRNSASTWNRDSISTLELAEALSKKVFFQGYDLKSVEEKLRSSAIKDPSVLISWIHWLISSFEEGEKRRRGEQSNGPE
jgi:hypothetical protein